jgi:hypothetical protein
MSNNTRHIGSEGFKWFFGVVEDRNDPQKLGRVRLRINTVHNTDNNQKLPTDKLPWAIPLVPITSASMQQVGLAPVGPMIGTTVFGFFMDGVEGQMPVYFGSLFGIPDNDIKKHDVPDLAREINTLNKQQVGPEPQSAFRAKYPYNKVFRSESGHVMEIDDTPNAERLHQFHKSGTYTEIDHQGRKVEKIVGDSYEVVVKNKTVYVEGSVDVVVKGSANITTNINIVGNVNVTGDISCTGQLSSSGINITKHTHTDPQGGSVGLPK